MINIKDEEKRGIIFFIALMLALARQEMGDRVKSDLRCRETPEAAFFPFSADVTGKKGKKGKSVKDKTGKRENR